MPITANPTAVGFWSPNDKGTTTVTWTSIYLAKVFRLVDGGSQTQFDDGPSGGATGSHTKQDATLELGHTYCYELRRTSNNTLLDRVCVNTYDVQSTLAEQVVQHIGFGAPSPPQQIINLTVTPGIDLVRISFRTTQPTIPVVTAKMPTAPPIFCTALGGGLRTKHDFIFGEDTPLRQNVQHTLAIVAAGHD